MDKAAESLLRELQDQFETKYGVNLGYGSVDQKGKNKWVVSLQNLDGRISVEGTGDTDIAAIEDAFTKAREQLSEQPTSAKQETTQSQRGFSEAFDDSFYKGSDSDREQSASLNQQPPESRQSSRQAEEDSHLETSDLDAEPSTSSKEQLLESDTASTEIEDLAEFDISSDVTLVFQKADAITPSEGMDRRSKSSITTSMLLFAIYDLARDLSILTEPPRIKEPEALEFLYKQLDDERVETLRRDYFYEATNPLETNVVEVAPVLLSKLSYNVLNVLKLAEEIAHRSTTEKAIQLRHFVAGHFAIKLKAKQLASTAALNSLILTSSSYDRISLNSFKKITRMII